MTKPVPLKKVSDETSPVETPAAEAVKACVCNDRPWPTEGPVTQYLNHPLTARQYVALEIYKCRALALPTMADAYNPAWAAWAFRVSDLFLAEDKPAAK